MQERFLYHSFPRPRSGESQEALVTRALGILSNLQTTGFVFAPEIVIWHQKLADGASRKVSFRQKRICFTELLDHDDLIEHTQKFGPFSLEFDIEVLRHMGAVPVAYIPQGIESSNSASGVGASLVIQMYDAKCLIERLQQVKDKIASDPDEDKITLEGLERTGATALKYELPTKVLSDFISWLGYKNPSMPLVSNALHGILSRMYPTDDTYNDKALAYYQQREWRLVDDLAVGGVRQVRFANTDEKERLLFIDQQFWQKELVQENYGKPVERFRRVDTATVLSVPESRSPFDLACSIIVPKTVIDEVRTLVGPKIARKVLTLKQKSPNKFLRFLEKLWC